MRCFRTPSSSRCRRRDDHADAHAGRRHAHLLVLLLHQFRRAAGARDDARAASGAHSLPDYVPINGRHNDWGFDPAEQRTRTYLGMGEEDINLHDQWAVESMGAIQDRTREHLGTSDKVIMAHRRQLLKAIETVRAGGTPPLVLAAEAAAALTGPDTIDCIAPAARWQDFWQQARPPSAPPHPGCSRQPPRPPRHDASPGAAACTMRRARRRASACCSACSDEGIERLRIAWGDLHGMLRGKTLMRRRRWPAALEAGIGMVSTLLLKDTSDRTAFAVFEPGALDGLPGFGAANNVCCCRTRRPSPCCPGRPARPGCAPSPISATAAGAVDPRRVLQRGAGRTAGGGLRPALRARGRVPHLPHHRRTALDPTPADWPAEPPAVALIHPGYSCSAKAGPTWPRSRWPSCSAPRRGWACRCARWRWNSGRARSRPCSTPADALTAADRMVLFRNGVKQALRRAGYHASFVCRPPFAERHGQRLAPAPVAGGLRQRPQCDRARCRPRRRDDAHAGAVATPARTGWAACSPTPPAWPRCCAPTINGYGRFRPQRDGAAGGAVGPRQPRRDAARDGRTRATPARASRTASASRWPTPTCTSRRRSSPGSTAWRAGSTPARPPSAPYAATAAPLPASLQAALRRASAADPVLQAGLGAPMAQALPRHQALRARGATRWPRTRRAGSGANISAAIDPTAASAAITIHLDSAGAPRRVDQRRLRAEPDARRDRGRHRRHRRRLRRLPHLRHLPRRRRRRPGRRGCRHPAPTRTAMLEMTAAPREPTSRLSLPDRADAWLDGLAVRAGGTHNTELRRTGDHALKIARNPGQAVRGARRRAADRHHADDLRQPDRPQHHRLDHRRRLRALGLGRRRRHRAVPALVPGAARQHHRRLLHRQRASDATRERLDRLGAFWSAP